MKPAFIVVLAISAFACVRQLPELPHSHFAIGAEPLPPRTSLERFYQATRTVDTTTSDTLTEIIVQPNFRNQYVRCTHLDGPPTHLSLGLRKHSTVKGTTGALLSVEYLASEALVTGGDRSLQLTLNGAILEPGSAGQPAPGRRHTKTEVAVYAVSAEALRQIVAADTANARVFGSAGRCEFPISGHARGLIALFLERELAQPVVAAWR